MLISTFNDVQTQIQKLYQEGDYTAALDLATSQSSAFPEQFPLLTYYKVSMAALAGQPQTALDSLRTLLDSGFWYNEVLLRKSASLSSLQTLPEYEALVEQNQRNKAEDQAHIYPMLVLRSKSRCQAGDSPCPLLLGLHGNASTAQASIEFWRPAASANWLVAALQSSQPQWKDAYVWDDHEYAEEEIKKHLASLNRQYSVDSGKIILAGYDQGGEIALELSLKGVLPVSSFIAIAPTGLPINEAKSWTTTLIHQYKKTNLCGYFIVGKEDSLVSRKDIRTLVKQLVREGISCELEEIPDAGHTFVPEFASSLLRAIEFFQSN
jgi:predicted esterase